MSDKIKLTINQDVAEITLNYPDKLNCIGFEMLHALDEAVDMASMNNSIRVVLIKGAGDRSFSTGADLKEFNTLSKDKAVEWIEFGNSVFNKIEELPKPTVALIHGYAIGGGLELALTCDFRLGIENAIFSSSELQHGWLPGWGGMTRLRRIIGEARAKEVVMLNEKIPAVQALQLGLLTRILNANNTDDELGSFLSHLAGLNPGAFKLSKAALMDQNRGTRGEDIQFDVLAVQIADQKENT